MEVVEKKGHLFQKGKSGNPAGRPKGSRNAISLVKVQVEGELRSQMQDHMPAILSKAIEAALAGDKDMIKMLYSSWVSKTVAADEEPTREKIQIVIGKLDQLPPISGKVINKGDDNGE